MVVLHLRETAVATFPADEARWNALACSPAHPFQPASTSAVSFQVHGCRANASHRLEHECDLGLLPWTTCAAQLLLPVHQGQQQRVSPLGPLGVMAICAKSWCTVCHHKSTRAEMPVACEPCPRCLFPRQPIGLKQRFNRLKLGSQRSSTSFEVCRVESASRQGCRIARHIGEALPPGTAHLLPVIDRGCTGCYLGLCLCDLGRVSLGTFGHFSRCCLAARRSRLACRRRPKMASE